MTIFLFIFFCYYSSTHRLFKIRLRRSASVFADDALLENTHGAISYDMSKIYHGELEGTI